MHKAKATALFCIDFRLQSKVQQWLTDNGYLGKVDEISVAGASRDLVKPIKKFHKDSLMRHLEISVKLHCPDEILVFDHQDCGGYAQDCTINAEQSYTTDKKAHLPFAKQVKQLLTVAFPGQVIKVFYVPLKKEIEELTLNL